MAFILFYTFYYLLDILHCISEHESQLNVVYVIIVTLHYCFNKFLCLFYLYVSLIVLIIIIYILFLNITVTGNPVDMELDIVVLIQISRNFVNSY
jgi:hypothetical protein